MQQSPTETNPGRRASPAPAIRTLTRDDGLRLLEFEIENREWFEQFIPPRPEEFYSVAGIAGHIHECLDGCANGSFHPCVLLGDDGRIIGRANLREMDLASRTAKIGYRIAKRHAGRGHATAAVTHLRSLARSTWSLSSLSALVPEINPASMRVLEKSGFTPTGKIRGSSVIRGSVRDCHEFVLDLTASDY